MFSGLQAPLDVFEHWRDLCKFLILNARSSHNQLVRQEIDRTVVARDGVEIALHRPAQTWISFNEPGKPVAGLHSGVIVAGIVKPEMKAKLVIARSAMQQSMILLKEGYI